MLRDRRDLEKKLISFIDNKGGSRMRDGQKIRNEWCWELLNKYNIPLAMSKDLISFSKDFSEYNEFVLFTVTDVVAPKLLDEYFSTREIKAYSNEKYKEINIDFPIKIPMIQVADDQFIGATTVQFLMKLRDAQLINYNADTQRALEVMVNNGRELYRPYVSKTNVKEIKELFADRKFISNTISLNINTDDEKADWGYDEKTFILYINNISAFDIFDGYHRYLGMAAVYMDDPSFDYPMELRITTFPTSKAKQFIWQEDHKTKMKKLDVDSLNQYDNGNLVVKRLNTDPESSLNGAIRINGGYISAGVMAKAIGKLFFKDKKIDRPRVNKVSTQLIKQLNNFTNAYPEYLNNHWESYEINIIIYGISIGMNAKQIYNIIENLTQENRNKLGALSINSLKEVCRYD